jgi:phosphoenolpyruvate---glycerone phosphotransferase subunit DhaL
MADVDPGIDTVALRRWLEVFARSIAEQKDVLTGLDAEIGDADHGANMHRGMQAVLAEIGASEYADPAALLKQVGMTLVRSVGGASGPLYGTFFLRFGAACGPRETVSTTDLVKAIRAGVEGLVARGRPELGDKTMFDSLHPALEALDAGIRAGLPTREAFASAWQAARRGRDDTIPMVARKGRASYLGERSVGHQDPGATSSALLFEAATAVFDG